MLRSVWQVILVTGILAAVSVPDCAAQGLKISTQVFDASKPNSDRRGQLISSSLTLCHNGRVYDYVASADELVIYDPVLRQFTVLNRTRGLFTVVTFEEIRHHMETRTRKTQEYLAELVARGEPGAEAEADAINAQMQPEFKETWDPMRGGLTLASAWLTYRVETRKWEDQQQVERYLVWRDWTALTLPRTPSGRQRGGAASAWADAGGGGDGPASRGHNTAACRTSADCGSDG